jgi:hypothetical protein
MAKNKTLECVVFGDASKRNFWYDLVALYQKKVRCCINDYTIGISTKGNNYSIHLFSNNGEEEYYANDDQKYRRAEILVIAVSLANMRADNVINSCLTKFASAKDGEKNIMGVVIVGLRDAYKNQEAISVQYRNFAEKAGIAYLEHFLNNDITLGAILEKIVELKFNSKKCPIVKGGEFKLTPVVAEEVVLPGVSKRNWQNGTKATFSFRQASIGDYRYGTSSLANYGFNRESEIDRLIKSIKDEHQVDLDLDGDNQYQLKNYMDMISGEIMRYPVLFRGQRYDLQSLLKHYDSSNAEELRVPHRDEMIKRKDFVRSIQHDFATEGQLIDDLQKIKTKLANEKKVAEQKSAEQKVAWQKIAAEKALAQEAVAQRILFAKLSEIVSRFLDEEAPRFSVDGLIYRRIPKNDDGHCFYQSVIACLYPDLNEDDKIFAKLTNYRKSVAARIEGNKEYYANFVTLSANQHSIEDYIQSVRRNEWATNVEVVILSEYLNRTIVVIGENGRIQNLHDITRFIHEPIFVYYHNNHYSAFILQPGYDAMMVLEGLLLHSNVHFNSTGNIASTSSSSSLIKCF